LLGGPRTAVDNDRDRSTHADRDPRRAGPNRAATKDQGVCRRHVIDRAKQKAAPAVEVLQEVRCDVGRYPARHF
jgi:hypothetical protein